MYQIFEARKIMNFGEYNKYSFICTVFFAFQPSTPTAI